MSLSDGFNLGHGFSKYFRIDAALDDAMQDDVFRIRHEVYCETLKFEPERPDRREIDEYDAHSRHCLLRTANEPHHPVGSARIVLTNPKNPDAPLPFEVSCAATLDRSVIDAGKLPRKSIAEISRLAVCGQYRRRKGEERSTVAIHDDDFASGSQPRFPFIPSSLLLGSVALAERSEIETVFVLTEPRLAAHFSRLGVKVTQIGGPISHRGTRIPSVMHVEEIIRNMRGILRPLWGLVREEIGRGFDQAAERQGVKSR